MKTAISNIAWEASEDEEVSKILKRQKVTSIEIAPTKYWSDLTKVSLSEVNKVKSFWKEKGISLVAFQSLLFGRNDLMIFEETSERKKTLNYLEKVLSLGQELGIEVAVFGSPKNRFVPAGMEMSEVEKIAEDFFNSIGNIAQEKGIYFCIEPNSKEYGCNFVNTAREARELVKKVNNPGFCLHLDTGVLFLNKEDYLAEINESLPLLKHLHISEPFLDQIKERREHEEIANFLRKEKYSRFISIEMRPNQSLPHPESVEKALITTKNYYG